MLGSNLDYEPRIHSTATLCALLWRVEAPAPAPSVVRGCHRRWVPSPSGHDRGETEWDFSVGKLVCSPLTHNNT